MEGIARYNYESLKRMVLAHPEDDFFFFFDRPYSKEFIFADNVKPIQIFPPTRHPLLIMYWMEFAVKRKLDLLKIDVFLSGDTYLSLRSKVPTVLVTHDLAYLHYPDHIPFSHRMHYQYYFPRFHKKAKEIIAVSTYTKEDIIDKYGISPEKITVAHNAPNGYFYPIEKNVQAAIRAEISNGKPYFVYLGSIHPRKNVVNLIKAFNLFKKESGKDYQLLIIGRPAWNTSAFYEAIEASPYKEEIIHRQFDRKDLPKYLGSAEALCYVSLFEGFGIPIVEAFEAGIPVITSNVSSMPEVAGDAALLADPADPSSIKEQLLKISSDPKIQEEFIQKGFDRLKKFKWENTAEIIYSKLSELASQ